MQDNNKKFEFLKKITFKKVFYPSASLIFALSIVLVFFFSVRFIVSSINKTFYSPSESEVAGQLITFDKANYIVVAKKLGISVPENQPSPAPQVTPPVEVAPTATSTLAVIDKKSIKIAIYNSTKTAGVAAKLKTILVGGGFEVAETGNKAPLLETTTIKIKESLNAPVLIEEIKTLVSSKYQITSTTLYATSTFDVEITIGKK